MSSQAQSPSSPPAVTTRQAEIIGLFGVVVSVIAAIISAIISANIAADSAVKSVTLQVTGETERSKQEFLRGQRQDLYGAVVDAHEAAQAREGAWSRALVAGRADVSEVQRRARESFSKFDENDGEVEVIASKAVSSAFEELDNAHKERIKTLLAYAHLKHNAPQNERDELKKKIQDNAAVLAAREDKLFDLMRDDLGNR